ncbi:eukaryotic translation initiation factor 6-2-like [Solanum stenotomum]|uniref:eukaryotic translation initiation factor 6-2-like n=1 Tax=Solanum stenotomum TaxID=172797 RepID=UPI0020D16073|nr:eukaryotic translation initiation factor 6-2-like [Solanum stenotomum]
MAIRLQFENSCDIGVYSKLTNAFCLVGIGGSQNFYSTFEDELAHIRGFQVIQTTINGSWSVGRLCAGIQQFFKLYSGTQGPFSL